MRDDDKALKIALASGLPAELKKAIAMGDKYREYMESRRYLFYLRDKGYLTDEVLEFALKNVEEYFTIEGVHTYQSRLSGDELSILGALSNVKGYDVKNDRPLLKPPDERISSISELMREDDDNDRKDNSEGNP